MTAALPSLAKLKPNPAWAALPLFDRTRWKRVRFGDVVENCNEKCDQVEVRLERFVAMEHLEPGSLHVRSWGSVADGTTFTRQCRLGQVLFGKRRAYQRKVAVAGGSQQPIIARGANLFARNQFGKQLTTVSDGSCGVGSVKILSVFGLQPRCSKILR